ncbi:fimbrial protein, partial [Escherichia coli]
DGDGSHGSTSKTPSYTKSVSWHHYPMVVTSNSNVGIKIYDKNNKEIKVNGGELPTDMGKSTVYGEKSGSVTFSAAPASLTGARPAPGQFTATATITVEIVR